MTTLARLFDNHTEAVAVVQALDAAGFDHDHVSIMASDGSHLGMSFDPSVNEATHVPADTQADAEAVSAGTGAGASVGTFVGGGLGLLAGLGVLAIPGFGQIVGAGWLIATLTGAGIGASLGGTGGGLAAALIHAGVPEAEAHSYAEGINAGHTLVTARVDESRVAAAERILHAHNPGALPAPSA